MKDFTDLEQEQALATYEGEDKVIPGNELLKDLRSKPRPKINFCSKIPKLDIIIKGGFHGGQLIVVSGITGQGKTTFCQSMTFSAMEQGLLSTWFSYELDMIDFLEQFPLDTVNNIMLPSVLKGRSPEWIEYRSWESKLKYGAQVVFVDHLHFLVDLHKSRNISFDIGSVVRSLKLLAIKHNLILFLICHTMKTRGDGDIELGLGDVRDSSLIEQEADIVLYVWRDLDVENRSILKIAKNRPAGIINKKIRLVYFNGRLREETDYIEDSGTETRSRSRVGKR
jgi:replicative DNA helicase